MRHQKAFRPLWRETLLVVVVAGLVSACGAASESDSGEGAAPGSSEPSGITPDSFDGVEAPADGVGESVGQITEALANCAFIEWCNEPGSWGTICRVRNTTACRSTCRATIAEIGVECAGDARAVCGSTVAPSQIRGCPPLTPP